MIGISLTWSQQSMVWKLARCEIVKRSGPSDHQERGPLIWDPFQSFSYHDLEWWEPPSKEQWDARSWKDQDRQITKNVNHRSELHLRDLPIATWSDKNLHRRNCEMQIHDEIWTIDSSRSWPVDLSSISEFHLSQLGVTRTSIEGITICEFTMRYGP